MSASPRDHSAEEAEQQAILEAGFASLEPPPGDELQDFMGDPDCAAPQWWWSEPAEDLSAAPPGEAWPGDGFADGGVFDQLAPGPALAGLTEHVLDAGLTRLDDDQLIGALTAVRRLGSWTAALEAEAVSELSRRREGSGRSCNLEFLADEIAIALCLSNQAATGLIGFCTGLVRLPATLAALRAGRIDRVRAMIIVDELSWLDEARALAVEQLIIGAAAGMTNSRLRARARRAVMAADPASAERRKRERQRDARVELWAEPSGTAALAGRDLPTAAALAADARIDAQARALKAAGSPATLSQLRAAVFLAWLAGQDVSVMLGAILGAPDGSPHPSQQNGAGTSTAETGPAGSEIPTGPDSAAAHGAEPEPAGSGAAGSGAAGSGAAEADVPEPDAPGPAAAGPGDGLVLRGSVHLTVPLTTWLELSAAPGEIAGLGPADAGTCRELADRIAASGGSRWCLSLTDSAGHAIAHACSSRPPSASLGEAKGWLRQMKIIRIESGSCSHARQVPRYRIPDSLHHIVKTRQRTCSAPGCNRRATRCDDDHTLPYDQGGRSCECNLSPLCRRHHRAKQAEGWYLVQAEPGVLVWTLPHGRRYTVGPGIYPA